MPRNSTKKARPASAPQVDQTTYDKFVANMKHYEIVEMSPEDPWATLRCPKSDCKQEFKVKRKEYKESKPQIGRSCPYCFRTSALPGAEITAENLNRGRG